MTDKGNVQQGKKGGHPASASTLTEIYGIQVFPDVLSSSAGAQIAGPGGTVDHVRGAADEILIKLTSQ